MLNITTHIAADGCVPRCLVPTTAWCQRQACCWRWPQLIYMERGLDAELADTVARQLMAQDPLSAHARDELGLSDKHTARPLQAAVASAVTFAIGAALPLLIAAMSSLNTLTLFVSAGSLITLALLGALAARAGGASSVRGALRVTLWGGLAMAATMGVGAIFGTTV